MSWTSYVSGGVGPARLAVLDAAGREVRACELPPSAELTESFEAVAVRRAAANGVLVEVPRGFRYRVKVKMGYVEVGWWRELALAFSAWRAGARLRFWPHADCERIYYAAAPAADFLFGYVAGKYLGYAGTLELVGTELLPYIPMTWTWDYFCAAGEEGYEPGEISYFADAAEEEYAPGEASLFSAVGAPG